jgi:hypothetical protein
MRVDWTSQVLSDDALLVLFINYLFFSMIILLFISFVILLTQSSMQINADAILSLLVVCFMLMNIIIANYLVYAMHLSRESKRLYRL